MGCCHSHLLFWGFPTRHCWHRSKLRSSFRLHTLGAVSLPRKICGDSSVYPHTQFPVCVLTQKTFLCVHTKDHVLCGISVQARKGEGPLVQSFLTGEPNPGLSPPCAATHILYLSSFQPRLPPGQLRFFLCSSFWILCHLLDWVPEDFFQFTASSSKAI